MSTVAKTSRTQRGQVVAVVAGLAVVQVLLVLVFAWSASRQTPHDLPMAVAGPPQPVQSLVAGIDAAAPGAFDLTVVSGEQTAQDAVTSRDAYGALVIGGTGLTLYTAPAASANVAAALAKAVPAAVAKANPQAAVTVTTLVPNPPEDPTGQGLPIALIPLTITSIAAGAAIGLLARSRTARVVALLGGAVLAGALSTWALQGVLGVLTGSWAANTAVMALVCLAISAGTTGMVALFGPAGIALSAVVVFFFGFPFSGSTSAWQMLPTPWGQIAQYLPVGASNTAVRSVAFFAGAGASAALAVLAAWAVVGLSLALILPGRPQATGTHEAIAPDAVTV